MGLGRERALGQRKRVEGKGGREEERGGVKKGEEGLGLAEHIHRFFTWSGLSPLPCRNRIGRILALRRT